MRYRFPALTTLDDVLPHIAGRKEFYVSPKGWYTVVGYAINLPDTFTWDDTDPLGSAIRRECRGLAFDTATGFLISRPYHKFFNLGEKPETESGSIDWSRPHTVLTKYDGSMIRPLPDGYGGFRLATKAGITEISMAAELHLVGKHDHHRLITTCLGSGLTPLFEWCSRSNRIVVDYPEDGLVLTAIRDNETGTYLDIEGHGVLCAERVAIDHARLGTVTDWQEGEGVVVRFEDGGMVKVKALSYVTLHKAKDEIGQEKNVLTTILFDRVDDLVPFLSGPDTERLVTYQKTFWAGLDSTVAELTALYEENSPLHADGKAFAVDFVNRYADVPVRPFLFGMRRNGPETLRDSLIAHIRGSLGSQTKVDGVRWIWKHAKW